MPELSPTADRVLRAAGWFPGRKGEADTGPSRPLSSLDKSLAERRFSDTVPGFALARELDDIEIQIPNPHNPPHKDDLAFGVFYCFGPPENPHKYLDDIGKALGTRVTGFGLIKPDFLLVLAEDGRAYGAYERSLFYVADSIEGAINSLIQGRELRQLDVYID
jgi:hypothetical protein